MLLGETTSGQVTSLQMALFVQRQSHVWLGNSRGQEYTMSSQAEAQAEQLLVQPMLMIIVYQS
jgi:hypothetical protein